MSSKIYIDGSPACPALKHIWVKIKIYLYQGFIPDATHEESSLIWTVSGKLSFCCFLTIIIPVIYIWCNIWRILLDLNSFWQTLLLLLLGNYYTSNLYLMQHLKNPPWFEQFLANSPFAASWQSLAQIEALYPSMEWHFYNQYPKLLFHLKNYLINKCSLEQCTLFGSGILYSAYSEL